MIDRWIVDEYKGRLLVGKQAHRAEEWFLQMRGKEREKYRGKGSKGNIHR